MIIRNYAIKSIEVLTPADNRPQTTVHRPQLTQLNCKPYFIPLLMKKRVIRKNVNGSLSCSAKSVIQPPSFHPTK